MHILGVTFDSKLSFAIHINRNAIKISKTVGILSRVRHNKPMFCSIILYKRLVESRISYCSCVWGHTYPKHLNRLFVLQKRALKYITYSPKMAHSSPIFKDLNLLTIYQLISYSPLIYIYKSVNPKLGNICNKFFEFAPKSNLRSNNQFLLSLPLCKFIYTQNSLLYKGVKLWNIVPLDIRKSKTLSIFKRKCFGFIFSNDLTV